MCFIVLTVQNKGTYQEFATYFTSVPATLLKLNSSLYFLQHKGYL
jgi:hypothetical protein